MKIKGELEKLEECSCMACTLCEHRSYLERQLNERSEPNKK